MQTTCWVCYSSSSALCIPQTALTGGAFSCREALLPGLTVCWYQLCSKSLSVPDISGGFAVSPFGGDVVCLSVSCFSWRFLFFSQISFAEFFSYLLINPFPHQASIILLKYNLIFFPEVHLFAFPLRFLFSAAKLFFLISILLMVSLFWLVPHFQKKIPCNYSISWGKGKKCSQQLKVVLSINCAKNCLQPPGFIQRLPVNDLSKGQVLTGIGIHVQNIFNNCILKWELQYFFYSKIHHQDFYLSDASTHLRESIFFWGCTLSKCPPLWVNKFQWILKDQMLSLSPFCAMFGIILAVVSLETVSKIVWQGSE